MNRHKKTAPVTGAGIDDRFGARGRRVKPLAHRRKTARFADAYFCVGGRRNTPHQLMRAIQSDYDYFIHPRGHENIKAFEIRSRDGQFIPAPKIVCHWLQFRKSDVILMWPDLSRGIHQTSPSFAISLEFHDNFVILTLMVSRQTSEHIFSFHSFALCCADWTEFFANIFELSTKEYRKLVIFSVRTKTNPFIRSEFKANVTEGTDKKRESISMMDARRNSWQCRMCVGVYPVAPAFCPMSVQAAHYGTFRENSFRFLPSKFAIQLRIYLVRKDYNRTALADQLGGAATRILPIGEKSTPTWEQWWENPALKIIM